MKKVGIVVLQWNNHETTINCLQSLEKLNYNNYELVVVDNASTKNSVAEVRKIFPKYRIIENKENRGYAAGNNTGIRYFLDKKEIEYIWILSNDTLISDPEVLKKMTDLSEKNPRAGMICPHLMGPKGEKQRSDFRFNPIGIFFDFIIPEKLQSIFFATDGRKIQEASYGLTTAPLYPRRIFQEIGLWDESYFLGGEDLDFSRRLRAAGYKIYVHGKADLIHIGGDSYKRDPALFKKGVRLSSEGTARFIYRSYGALLGRFFLFLFALGGMIRSLEHWTAAAVIFFREGNHHVATAKNYFQVGKTYLSFLANRLQ